ncbi:MAG: TonB family protein [Verrucomicrobiota bacterium]
MTMAATSPGHGTTTAVAYQVRSELSMACLPQSSRDPGRKLAWVNALCAMFLVTGLVGIKAPLALVLRPVEVDEPLVIPVEVFTPNNEAPPPEEVQELPEDAVVTDAPVLPTLVAPDPSKVAFAVPVQGPTVTARTAALASPPPPRTVVQAKPAPTGPVLFRPGAGQGGYFPKPQYPRDAQLRKEQGEVQLFVEVGEDGQPTKVEVRISSGSPTLDRETLNHVRRFWRWTPGEKRQFLVPWEWRLL